ncbi:MAG: class F sortase [Gordonia sp. (in: high G+C Gram-positive bacteria)]|uniref:class F sortase n=1 Tax=Gordonia sp. (in: high G+C Gram-positive bacteria) TaxID=84139 RepID=UPI003C727632
MKQAPSVRRTAITILTTIAAVLTLVMVSGCQSGSSSPPDRSDAQASMPAPVAARSDEPSTPTTLRIGDSSAPTDPVATDAAGVLLPPQNIARLGWWADSALPGSGAGTVVVTGHVDDVSQGRGYAAKFASLKVGDAIVLTTVDGQQHTYRVTKNNLTLKGDDGQPGALPVEELNRLTGPETLALVTCGGPFVGPPLGYRDNVVVFAVPA